MRSWPRRQPWLASGCGLVLVAAGFAHHAAPTEGAAGTARAVGPGPVVAVETRLTCTSRGSRLGSRSTRYAAIARRSIAVVVRPDGPIVERLPRLDADRYPTVFGVLAARRGADCAPTWYYVQLPTFPNGSRGWIAASGVRLFKVDSRIVVNLTERRLRAFRKGKEVLDTKVAVGAPQTPTPVGRFYVNERIVLDTLGGPFGPAVLGISAHSEVLRNWAQGGPIALHGTDEPRLIGEAASHGCIRLANDVMRRLFALIAVGTPVLIRT